MNERIKKIAWKWKEIKSTSTFHDAILFLIFICVSAVFWFILALNDSAQDSFNVKLSITNMPDSVTFISYIPEKMHVCVRDKGTMLWRNGVLKRPSINIDFKEFASNGVLRFSNSDIQSALKSTFGGTAQITALSLDSIRLEYTTNPGRKVPVVVSANIYPSSGNIMEGNPTTVPASVFIYGEKSVIDSINYVTTEHIELQGLTESSQSVVKIKKIPGVRIMPKEVELRVPIEPLVKKDAMITVTPINVPENQTILLFPSKVPVSYYVAMSRLNEDDDPNIELEVDYLEIDSTTNAKLKVFVKRYPERLKNLTLASDSVEFALVKN